MPQAIIEVGGVPGSVIDAPINILVQLSNDDVGDESTYTWSIVDQPSGAANLLSDATIENPTFTPRKEGTYLLRLIVDNALATETQDQVVVAVRQLKTRARIPAASETLESDGTVGWKAAVNLHLQDLDQRRTDPATFVAQAGGALVAGDIVRVSATATIKVGLPGEEIVPRVTAASAATAAQVRYGLAIVIEKVGGGAAVALNELGVFRTVGLFAHASLGAGVVGDPVYVSDASVISVAPGTIRRVIGIIVASAGAARTIYFDGRASAGEVDPNATYLLNSAQVAGTLPNAVNVTGLAALLRFAMDIASANTILTVLALRRSTSNAGFGGVGIGAALDLETEDNAGTFDIAARVAGVLTDVTAGVEISNVRLSALLAGALTELWGTTDTGAWSAIGGNRQIKAVLDPTGLNDAANLNWSNRNFGPGEYVFGADASPAAPGTVYVPPGKGATSAFEFTTPIPTACSLSNLRVKIRVAGHDGILTVTVRKNGAGTALTVAIPAATDNGAETTENIAFAAGDLLSVQMVAAAGTGAGATDVMIAFQALRA